MSAQDRNALGSLPQPGALEFQGVTMRVFPLRANLELLTRFCDRYLNIAPEIAYFRPAMPYVLMMAVNYGRMSEAASNLGWVAQREFLFNVVLEWYVRARDGRLVFHDWAQVSPFIFVDNELSIERGRETYGWPKVLASLDEEVNAWMEDPRARRRLLTMRTLLFSRMYAGQPLAPRVLLEIDQEASQALLQMPPEPYRLLEPLARIPGAVVETFSSAFEMMGAAAGLGRGDGALGGRNRAADPMQRFLAALGAGGAPSSANLVNLKQFRASDPEFACYQSLVNAKMRFARFNAGGLLGSLELLRGDPAAGFRIRIHKHAAYPIVDSLGIAAAEEESRDDVAVSILRPYLPFWLSVDLRYDMGERICWRTERAHWLTRESADGLPCAPPSPDGEPDPPVVRVPARREPRLVYNTSLGPVVDPMGGPFVFSDTSLRVLPLRASHVHGQMNVTLRFGRLVDVIPQLAGVPPRESQPSYVRLDVFPHIEPSEGGEDGTLVFLIATNHGRMSSQANDVGWWARRSVSLSYLVRATFCSSDHRELFENYWLHPVFMFGDSPLGVTTGREVTGLPSRLAHISGGLDPWIEDRGNEASRRLLTVEANIYPALGVGQTRRRRALIQVEQVLGVEDQGAERAAAVAEDLGEWLRGGASLRTLNHKSFPDEEQPGETCYEGLVAAEELFADPVEAVPLEGPLRVKLLREPDYGIASRLGLASVGEEVGPDGTAMLVLEDSLAPFYVRSGVRTTLPQDFAWQAGAAGSKEIRGYEQAWEYLQQPLGPFSEPTASQGEAIRTFDQVVNRVVRRIGDGSGGATPRPGGEGRRSRARIHFESGSDQIGVHCYSTLRELAEAIRAGDPEVRVRLEAHTDDRGDADHNFRLARRRAESVKQYLVQSGLSEDRVESQSYGYIHPLVRERTETAWAANRRVDVTLIGLA